MSYSERAEKCRAFFEELTEKLGESYEVSPVLGRDESRYLVPKGRTWLVSYYGKPRNSYRLAYHWNWYASLEKCTIPGYIQCFSKDMPRPRRRPEDGSKSKARNGWQVAVLGEDDLYHAIYGDVFDRHTKEWYWLEQTVDEYLESLKGRVENGTGKNS